MQIIPVIDLKDGVVVHAVRGERSHYQPIQHHSKLCAGSTLAEVMEGFLQLSAFQTFYIADLNAISGQGHHQPLITELLSQYPGIEFWVDNGSQLKGLNVADPANYTTVIGTESQLYAPFKCTADFILSLDYQRQQASGHAGWFEQAEFWPERLIVMTLNRVGSQDGPDFAKLAEFTAAYPEKQFIAAGGVRHYQDLQVLAGNGVKAALLATALHSGAITQFDF
ncbi:histidine biosynthesis protein [Methylomonas paludis]|uniref:Histidine biosynthesis protein n=1 Tax=Methylomonas paludis TaxID=1173101 RepID=A0A975MLE2_9GAMM|nr:HisA/HisF-related TIM barrel protein [Methylomonas paludis]QWF69967.1 histidine biosynthesis protein [Methylomonas paludis]